MSYVFQAYIILVCVGFIWGFIVSGHGIFKAVTITILYWEQILFAEIFIFNHYKYSEKAG